jgi:hypothetical protein
MLAAELSLLMEEWETVKTRRPDREAALAARRIFARRDELAKRYGACTGYLSLEEEHRDELLAALRILCPELDWETPRASALDEVSAVLIEWLRLEPQSEWDTQKADALEQARRALCGSDAWGWLSGYPSAALRNANDPNHLLLAATAYYLTKLLYGSIEEATEKPSPPPPDLDQRFEHYLWAEHHMGNAQWNALALLEQVKILRRDYERRSLEKEARPPVPPLTETESTQPASTYLRIDGNKVYVEAKLVPLNMTAKKAAEAILFLVELAKEPGNWLSGPDIDTHLGRARKETRWDLIFKALPEAIRDVIDSQPGRGYCLRK